VLSSQSYGRGTVRKITRLETDIRSEESLEAYSRGNSQPVTLSAFDGCGKFLVEWLAKDQSGKHRDVDLAQCQVWTELANSSALRK
jgi:hypothetical protein